MENDKNANILFNYIFCLLDTLSNHLPFDFVLCTLKTSKNYHLYVEQGCTNYWIVYTLKISHETQHGANFVKTLDHLDRFWQCQRGVGTKKLKITRKFNKSAPWMHLKSALCRISMVLKNFNGIYCWQCFQNRYMMDRFSNVQVNTTFFSKLRGKMW